MAPSGPKRLQNIPQTLQNEPQGHPNIRRPLPRGATRLLACTTIKRTVREVTIGARLPFAITNCSKEGKHKGEAYSVSTGAGRPLNCSGVQQDVVIWRFSLEKLLSV